MKTASFKFILLGMLYFLWPGQLHAEMSRMQVVKQGLKTFSSDFNLEPQGHGINIFKEKTQKIKIHKWFFQKWTNPDGRRALLIAGIVILALGIFIFMLYAIAAFLAFAVFDEAAGFLLLSLLFFGLTALCIVGISNNSRKLSRTKYKEEPQEKFPPRPPSKNLKKQ